MSPYSRRGTVGEGLGCDPWRSLTLLHFYFWWSQEGPVFLLSLSFRIGLEVLPAVHATISTFLKIFLPLPFSFGLFLSFSLFLPLLIPFMHLSGFSLFPFSFQLSKEFHCQFVYCLFKQLRVILHICGLSFH